MQNNNNELNIKEAAMLLDSLCIYRNLLEDPVINAYRRLLKHASGIGKAEDFTRKYAAFYHLLALGTDTLNLPFYLAGKVIYDENPFTLPADKTLGAAPAEAMAEAVRRDLEALQTVSALSAEEVKEAFVSACQIDVSTIQLIRKLPAWNSGYIKSSFENEGLSGSPAAEGMRNMLLSGGSWSERTSDLLEFHRVNGAGSFAGYYAFTWNPEGPGEFVPVANPDPVRFSDLIAYESEREEVIRNTEQFLAGYQANNVLLYGDRGTGKSSTVKALLNEYHRKGLRMIEVPKSRLADFPRIVGRLAGRNQKFIIFVDDLAFEDNEENYTALKAALEGGLEVRPPNVLIYATSNRRHLIKEKFSDRAGLQYGSDDDEVRAADSIQEKLSLSDRFGITVIFPSPDKSRYLAIIEGLADRKGIRMDRETLHKEAMKWELWYNGCSPRTARQFINWLEGGRD